MASKKEVLDKLNSLIPKIHDNGGFIFINNPQLSMELEDVVEEIITLGKLNELISKDILGKHVNKLIRSHIETSITDKEFDEFLLNIENTRVECHVFKLIYGGRFESYEKRIEVGKMIFISNYASKTDYGYDYSNEHVKMVVDGIQGSGHCAIALKVTAHDTTSAIVLSESIFQEIELILNLASHIYPGRWLGLVNIKQLSLNAGYALSDTESSERSLGDYPFLPLDALVKNEIISKLLLLVQNDNKSEFEKRLLRAAKWIGLAIFSGPTAAGFVNVINSLETMTIVNETGIVSPSIISQLGETVAIILEKTCNARKELYKQITHLYSVRSACVHGGTDVIKNDNYLAAIKIAEDLLVKLLIDEEYRDMHSMKELNRHITDIKYS